MIRLSHPCAESSFFPIWFILRCYSRLTKIRNVSKETAPTSSLVMGELVLRQLKNTLYDKSVCLQIFQIQIFIPTLRKTMILYCYLSNTLRINYSYACPHTNWEGILITKK